MAIIDKPSDYFNTVLYTGNGAVRDIVTGHATDLAWLKVRNTTGDHYLFDSVRGTNNYIRSNRTDAEGTLSGTLTSFNSDGYSLGTTNATNTSGETQVGWSWVAGGAASSNTDGSITSSVSANTDAGFSIVSYTSNGTSGATIGHGLGVAPSMIIMKNRSWDTNWFVYHQATGNTGELRLNSTSAFVTDSTMLNNTTPSSSLITLGNNYNTNFGSGYTYIAYCFAEKQGYSKFGSYTGNGSTDGTFVYLGFKPAFVLIKKTSGVEDWYMFDNKRDSFNIVGQQLSANTSAAEGDNQDILDFLSNGFKLKTTKARTNESGANYIFMCFAESPFTTSTGVPACAR